MLTTRTCRCGHSLDPLGDHRAACATSGVLPTRALPLKHALARVCREAGARVARNVRVADMNIDVPASDARRIEVVCNGLPLWHGAQLAVDATLVSPLTRDGQPQPTADAQPGVALARAARRKRRHTYPELFRARRCRLVVFGIETGGRWSEEAATFLRLLVQARAASAPVAVRRAAQAVWVYRWSGILSVAAQRAFAASLLELPAATELGAAGDPALHELLADARWLQAPANSCLPARPAEPVVCSKHRDRTKYFASVVKRCKKTHRHTHTHTPGQTCFQPAVRRPPGQRCETPWQSIVRSMERSLQNAAACRGPVLLDWLFSPPALERPMVAVAAFGQSWEYALKIARGYVLYETYMYLIKSYICLARGYILILSMYK